MNESARIRVGGEWSAPDVIRVPPGGEGVDVIGAERQVCRVVLRPSMGGSA